MAFKLFEKKVDPLSEQWNIKTMFGPNTNFAVTEAYKLLRTNLMFSFPDDDKCHVVGVTSPVQGEGKSSTACNIAYAMAEAGAKVLLLEADLRKPTIGNKLGLARSPGLTNLLVARWEYQEVVQHCSVAPKMDVITSGDIPPNPSEILGSDRMEQILKMLKEHYEYIIVDLPPVTVVSDAVAASRLLDGMLVVVRGRVSNQKMLAEALRQLRLVNVRILGFVYRDNGRETTRYARYSKRYRYRYYYDYGKRKSEKK